MSFVCCKKEKKIITGLEKKKLLSEYKVMVSRLCYCILFISPKRYYCGLNFSHCKLDDGCGWDVWQCFLDDLQDQAVLKFLHQRSCVCLFCISVRYSVSMCLCLRLHICHLSTYLNIFFTSSLIKLWVFQHFCAAETRAFLHNFWRLRRRRPLYVFINLKHIELTVYWLQTFWSRNKLI